MLTNTKHQTFYYKCLLVYDKNVNFAAFYKNDFKNSFIVLCNTVNLIAMCKFKLLGVILWVAVSSSFAQNPMQSGAIDKMVELIKTNVKLAQSYAESAVKSDKENTNMIATIGSAYLQAGNIEEAEKYFQRAQRCYKISPKAINLGGDIAQAKGKIDSAKYYYNRAMYFDRHDPEAYFKYAELVKFNDLSEAMRKLDFIKQLRPDLSVDGKIADLYYGAQQYDAAIASYEKEDSTKMTEDEFVHYAQSLLLTGNYNKALEIAEKGCEVYPHNTDLVRLMLYCNTDSERFDKALENAKELIDMNNDSTKIRYTDYLYYGYALNGLQRTSEAIQKFEQARALGKNVLGVDKEISEAYSKIGDYDNAIKYANEGLAKITDSAYDRSRDLFQLGLLYWRKATSNQAEGQKSDEELKALKDAEKVFAEVSRLRPDSYVGFYWRAKANALMDPKFERGLAKPYYQQAAELLERSGGDKDYIIECYKQLSYYYYTKKVMPQAISYAEKIIKLDPEDSYAKQLLEIVSTKKVKR